MVGRPAIQWYAGDWKRDPQVGMCSPATRGVWMDWLCAMHELDGGEISGTVEQLARLGRCTPEEAREAIDELRQSEAANVEISDGRYRIVNRRMVRDAEERRRDRERKRHVRHLSGDCPDDVREMSGDCPGNVPSVLQTSVSTSKSDCLNGQSLPDSTVTTGKTPLEAGKPDQLDFSDLASDAFQVARKVPGKDGPQRRQLIARAVILSRTKFSEHWLWDAVEGVVQCSSKNPGGYFRKCLLTGSGLSKPAFDAVLNGLKVPRGFYQAWDNFSLEAPNGKT